jgi:hypothetical protein
MEPNGGAPPTVPEATCLPITESQSEQRGFDSVPLSGNPLKTEENAESNIVNWDGPDDPENPLNWKTGKVTTIVAIVSTITFLRLVGRHLDRATD